MEKTGTGEYTVRFTHPTWGQVRLVTRQRGDDLALGAGEGAQPGEISMAVLDDEGQELWFSSTDDGYLLHPAGVDGDASASVTSPMDDAGNIFVEYFAGRSAGVVVLRPTANGMEDFGSLPDDLRFAGQYDARVEDSDSDGVYEIAVDFNPCDPSCADGGLVTAIYRWNGSDFESSLPPAETVEPPLPGSPCTVGSSPDCIDPDGTGTGTYLSGGADCMATFAPDSTDLCNDYDGDGKAGFPDGGGD